MDKTSDRGEHGDNVVLTTEHTWLFAACFGTVLTLIHLGVYYAT